VSRLTLDSRAARPASRRRWVCLPVPIPEPLFQDTPRDNPATKQAAESTYKFLDRVADPVFARVRETLSAWFDRFAERQDQAAVADLRGRLRAKRPL
jgi:hypothetical protein